jgi:AcrR family transcriptional regulator
VSSGSEKRSPVRTKVREAVSEAILDAAEAVALENGIEAASAAAIAQRAGVAVGTLYNYFPDRDGILSALFKNRRGAIVPALDTAATAAAGQPFEDRLRTYVRRLIEVFEANASFLRLAVRADGEGAAIKGRDKTLMTQVLHHIEQIMREGASRKLFPMAKVPAYARMFQAMLKALILWRVEEGAPLVWADGELAIDAFLHGVTR